MKAIFLLIVAGYIPALLATNNAAAQSSVSTEILDSQKNDLALERRISYVTPNTAGMEVISTKAIKTFAKSYKDVSGEQWEKIEDGYTAKFILNGVTNRIYFDKKGKWSGSLKSYSEDKLPYEMRDIVKRTYYDFTITYVQEVETIDSHKVPTYIIHLQDKDQIKLVRLFDGEMETWKEYKRG